jgi:16S rRNA (cytidine1402-2'-O)-methyltransferase
MMDEDPEEAAPGMPDLGASDLGVRDRGVSDPGGGARPVPPGLHVVSVPIGAARDITLRALDLIAGADLVAAEDTRALRRLMAIHGIRREARSVIAYHDHNAAGRRPGLIAALAAGRSVALVAEAGTPLVADPGYRLVAEAIAAGVPVHAAPGPSALLAALAVAGLPTDRFLFAGFLPPRQGPRARALAALAAVPATLVFYESPRRLAASLAAMAEALGGARQAAVCRELTKRFEEVRRGPLAALAGEAGAASPPRGEIVVVVGPPGAGESGEVRGSAEVGEPASDAALDHALGEALARLSLREAAGEVARALGRPRRQVYARALLLAGRR